MKKNVLLFTLMLSLLLIPSLAHAALTDDILYVWELDDNAANTIVVESVSGLNGAANVNTNVLSGAEHVGTSFNLSGSSNYVEVIGLNLSAHSETTLCQWVNPSKNMAGTDKSFEYYLDASNRFSLDWTQNVVKMFYNDAGTNDNIVFSQTWATDVWQHVCLIGNVSHYTLYFNGSFSDQQANTVGTWNGFDGSGQLGRFGGGGDYLEGSVDQTAIWSRALTSTEITDLYASGTGLAYASFPAGIAATPYCIEETGVCYASFPTVFGNVSTGQTIIINAAGNHDFSETVTAQNIVLTTNQSGVTLTPTATQISVGTGNTFSVRGLEILGNTSSGSAVFTLNSGNVVFDDVSADFASNKFLVTAGNDVSFSVVDSDISSSVATVFDVQHDDVVGEVQNSTITHRFGSNAIFSFSNGDNVRVHVYNSVLNGLTEMISISDGGINNAVYLHDTIRNGSVLFGDPVGNSTFIELETIQVNITNTSGIPLSAASIAVTPSLSTPFDISTQANTTGVDGLSILHLAYNLSNKTNTGISFNPYTITVTQTGYDNNVSTINSYDASPALIIMSLTVVPVVSGYTPTYDASDLAPVLFDGFGTILAFFVAFASIIGLLFLGKKMGFTLPKL